jgi:hypothetical protein
MGSWNQTCAISNLPIRDGEEVITFFVIGVHGGEDPNKYLIPFPFYCDGKYNDYGYVDEESGPMLETIIDALNKMCIPYETGENPYHEREVVPGSFTWETIGHAEKDERLCLKVQNYFESTTSVAEIKHLQVRRDVFDTIIENYKVSVYKTGHYGEEYSFTDIMEDYVKFYNDLTAWADKDDIMKVLSDPWSLARENFIFTLTDKGGRRELIHNEFMAKSVLTNLVKEGATEEQLYPAVENAVHMEFLNLFMRDVHRQWQVPGYAGQDSNTEAHMLLASIIIDGSEKIHANDYYEEDHEES